MNARSLAVAVLFLRLIGSVQTRAQSPSPQSTASPEQEAPAQKSEVKDVSPDKQWGLRFDSDGNPEIVRMGSSEAALQLYDKCGPGLGSCKPLIWAPNSKRFALNAPNQGRYRPTSFFQLKGDKWEEVELPDAVDDALEKAIAPQMKKKGLSKNTDLRLISNPVWTVKWIDADTALVYGSKGEVLRKDVEVGFDAAFLFTLKFNQTGECKIVKSQRLSEKESRKYDEDSEN